MKASFFLMTGLSVVLAAPAFGQTSTERRINSIEDASLYLLERSTFSSPDIAIPAAYSQGARFGDWLVIKESDEMSPTSIVSMITVVEHVKNDGEPTGRYNYFGFQIFGGIIVTVNTNAAGKNYWPYCEFNTSSISVDGSKAIYITDRERGGACSSINASGAAFRQMKSGSQARVRLLSYDLSMSLSGFTAALNHARSLSR